MTEGGERGAGHREPWMHDAFIRDHRLRPLWRFAVAAIFAYAANYVAAFVAYVLFARHPLLSDALFRVLMVIILLGGFRFMLLVLDEEEGDVWTSMGLPRGAGALRDTMSGILIGAGMIALAALALGTLGHLAWTVRIDHAAPVRLGLVTISFLFGAMVEESMFRGYPFQRLMESAGPVAAILILSPLFAAAHFSNPANGGLMSWEFFNTAAVGALFAVAYLRTSSLWMPFGMHFAWNFTLGVVLGLPVSGERLYGVVVRGTATGPHLLTGGAYGLEGSATGAAVILIGFIPVLLLTRKHPRTEGGNIAPTGI